MLHYWPMVALIVGVLQVCTADEDEPVDVDVAKLCSAYELQRARNSGVSDDQLREANALGLTCDEIIRVMPERAAAINKELENTYSDHNLTELLCNIIAPERTLLTNLSIGQDANLKELFEWWKILRPAPSVLFLRFLCEYASRAWVNERDAKGCYLEVVPYMKMRFLSQQSRNASNEIRVRIAIQMCYIFESRQHSFDYMNASTIRPISEEEMKGFLEVWSEFMAEGSPYFAAICDFLIAKNILNYDATIGKLITFDQKETGK